MTAKLTPPTSIRLSEAQLVELTAIAGAKGITVSDVIRQRLDSVGPLYDTLQQLQQDVEMLKRGQGRGADKAAGKPPGSATSEPAGSHAIQLEILFLLRGLAPPERLDRARAEMERLGIQFWQGNAA